MYVKCTKGRGNGGIYCSSFILEIGRLLLFQVPGLYSRHPFKSRLYGLRIILAFVVQRKYSSLF